MYLLVGELLAQVGHDVAQLGGGDETVAIDIESLLESLHELLLGVGALHLAGHKAKELGEINGAVAISIDLVDHILKLSLSRVLTEGPHDGSELLGGDCTFPVVKMQESKVSDEEHNQLDFLSTNTYFVFNLTS